MDLLNKNLQLEHAPEQVMGDTEKINNNNNKDNKNLENLYNKNSTCVDVENKKFKNTENEIIKKYNKKITNNLFPDRFRASFRCGHRCKLDVLTGDFHVPCSCNFYKSMRSNTFGYEYNIYRRRMEEFVKFSDEEFNRDMFVNVYDTDLLVVDSSLKFFPKYMCYDERECLPYSAGMNFQAYTLLKQFDLYEGYTSLVVGTANVSNEHETNELFFYEVSKAYYNRKEDFLFYAAPHKGCKCACPIHFFKALYIYELYVEIGVPFNDLGAISEKAIPIVDTYEYYLELVNSGDFENMVRRLFEVDLQAHRYTASWITSELTKIETFLLANFFPSLVTDGVSGALGQLGFRFRNDFSPSVTYHVMITSLPVIFGHYLHITFQGVLTPPVIEFSPCLACDNPICNGGCIWDGPLVVAEGPKENNFILDEESDSSESEDYSVSLPGEDISNDEMNLFLYGDIHSDPYYKYKEVSESEEFIYTKVYDLHVYTWRVKRGRQISEYEHAYALELFSYLENSPPSETLRRYAEASAQYDLDAEEYHEDDYEFKAWAELNGNVLSSLVEENDEEHYDFTPALLALAKARSRHGTPYPHPEVKEEGRSRVEFNKKKIESEFREFVKRMPRADVKLVFQQYKRDKKRIYTALPDARRIDMQNFLDWLHLHNFDKVKCESNLTNLLTTFGLEGAEFTIYGITIFSAFYHKQWLFLFYEFMTNDYWTVADEHIRNVVLFLQNCFLGTHESLSEAFMDSVIVPIITSVGITLEDFAYGIARLVGFKPCEVEPEAPLRENLLMEAFLKMVTVVSMSNYLKELAPVEYLVAFVEKVKVLKTDAYEPVKVSFEFFRAFGQCCVECYEEKSFMPLLRWDNIQAFTDDHIDWLNSVKLSIKPTIAWFEDKRVAGEALQERCRKLMKKGAMSSIEYTRFSQALSIALYQLENRKKACEMAPQAFGVILRGRPGGGKTALGEGLHKMVAAMNGIDPSISLGQMKIDSKHQTNVLNHVVTLLFNDVDLAPKGDPQAWIATCEALRAGVDTAPFQTEQASLEDKENAFVKPQLTVVTTNSDMWYFGEISGEKFMRRYPLVAYVDAIDCNKEVSLDNMKIMIERLVVTGDGVKNKPCVGKFQKTGVIFTGSEFLASFRSMFTKHHQQEKENIVKRNLAYQFCKFGATLESHVKDDVKVKCCNDCNILEKDELQRFGRNKARDIIANTKCVKYENPGSRCDGFACFHCALANAIDTKCGAGVYLWDHYMPCDDCKCELNWEEVSYCLYGKHAFEHTDFCGEFCHIYRPGIVCDCGLPWPIHTQQCDTTLYKCRFNPIRQSPMEPFFCNQARLMVDPIHSRGKCEARCNYAVVEDLHDKKKAASEEPQVNTEGPRELVRTVYDTVYPPWRLVVLSNQIFNFIFDSIIPPWHRSEWCHKHLFSCCDGEIYSRQRFARGREEMCFIATLRGRELYDTPGVEVNDYAVYCKDSFGQRHCVMLHADLEAIRLVRNQSLADLLRNSHVDFFGEIAVWRSPVTGRPYPVNGYPELNQVLPEGPCCRERGDSLGLEIESDDGVEEKKCCSFSFDKYWWKHLLNSFINVIGISYVAICIMIHHVMDKTVDRMIRKIVPDAVSKFFSTPGGIFLLRVGQGVVLGSAISAVVSHFKMAAITKEKSAQMCACQECEDKCNSIKVQHLAKLNGTLKQPVTEALKYSDNPEKFLVYGIPMPDQVRINNGVEYDKSVLAQPLLINNPRLATSTFDDILNVARASTLEIDCGGLKLDAWIYNQGLIIINTHFLPILEKCKIVVVHVKKARKYINYEFNYVDVVSHGDLSFIKLPGLGNGIEPFLYPAMVTQLCSGRLVNSADFSYLNVVVKNDFRSIVAGQYAPTTFYGYVAPSEPGWCGRLLFLEVGSKWGIAGIHSHGSDESPKVGLSTPVYPSLAPHVLIKKVEVVLDENIKEEGIINIKSPLALFPDAIPLGTYPNSMSETPKIMKSDLYDLGASMLPPGVVYDYPKKKDSGIVDGVWRHGVKKKALGVSTKAFFSTELATMMIRHTVGQINESAQPLTVGVALVGLEGMTKGMNPKTSNGPGFYHVKNKNELIDDKGQVVEWFQMELLLRLMGYDNGTIRAWETVFQRKAEVLPLEKIATFATRIFTVGGLDLNVLAKMFMGPLNDIVLKHFRVFRCAGKINATSRQWNNLFKEIMKYPFRLFADESGFDAKHKGVIFHVVAEWMRQLAIKVGYTQKAADIVYVICMNALHQVVQYKGDFIYIDYMLGSGFFLTLLLNSLVHLYLLWIAYAFIVARDIVRFFEEVVIALVGDDMAGSTSNENFNLLTIAKVLNDLCGYVITSSIKGNELTKFSAPEEESFLKRTWRYDEELDMYMGALYFGSVIKPIMFYEYNKEESQASKLKQTLDGLQRECFFHGREVFEKYARDPRVVKQYEVYGVVQHTYDELKIKYLEDNEYFASWDQTLKLDGRETLNRCTQSVSPAALVTEGLYLQTPLTLASGYAISEEMPKAASLLLDNVLTELYNSNDKPDVVDEVIATTAFDTSLKTLDSLPAPTIKSGQYGDEYYQNILEKPVYIGTSFISNVVDSFEIADVMSAWMTHANISPLITRYSRFRGCPKITLVCNGSSYFFGRAIMGVDHIMKLPPNFGAQSFGSALRSVHQLCQLPHLPVDYSKSESYSIKVPWMCPNDFINTVLPTASQNYVTHKFYLMGVNTLACIDPTIVAPTMTFAVYISMEDIQFSVISGEGPKELEPDGIISGPLKAVSAIVKSIPSLPPNFTPYTTVADGLADLLAKVGLGKAPMLEVNPTTLISNPHFMNEDGRAPSHILSNQTKQSKTLNAPDFASDDDMSIEKVCAKWFFFKEVYSDSSQAVGTKFGSLELGPSCSPRPSSSTYFPGPTAWVASMFDYWRGDFEVKIEVMGTAYHRGILSFTVDGFTAPTYSNALNKSRVYTLDISQERELIIPVPYRRQEPYICLINHDAFDGEDELSPYITHAVINCWITAPISVGLGTGVQLVWINFYIRTVNNDFQQPTMTKWKKDTAITLDGPVVSTEGPEPFISNSTSPLGTQIFGEKYSSLKQLNSMMTPYGTWFDGGSGSSNIGVKRHPLVPIPPQYSTLHENFYPSGYWEGAEESGWLNGTYTTIIAPCYFAQKGGYRYAIDARYMAPGSGTIYSTAIKNIDIELMWAVNGPLKAYILDANQLFDNGMYMNYNKIIADNEGGLTQFKVPDYHSAKFRPACVIGLDYRVAANANPNYDKYIAWAYKGYITAGNTTVITLFVAGDDDNACFSWRFCPRVIYNDP